MALVDGTRTIAEAMRAAGIERYSAITRADIAAFLLDQLTDTRFGRAAPAISN